MRARRVLPAQRSLKLPAGEDLRQEHAVPEIHGGTVGQLLLYAGPPRCDEQREERRQHEHLLREPEEEPHPEHTEQQEPNDDLGQSALASPDVW